MTCSVCKTTKNDEEQQKAYPVLCNDGGGTDGLRGTVSENVQPPIFVLMR